MRTHTARLAAALLLTALPLAALAAQRPTPIPPDTGTVTVTSPRASCGVVGLPDCPPGRFGLGGVLEIAQPLAEFKEHVDVSVGATFTGRILVAPGSPLGLVVNGGFISYGSEREHGRVFYAGFPIDVRLQTSNRYAHFGAGPELALRTGAVRPYIGGTVGVGHFGASQSLSQEVQNQQTGDYEWQEVWSEGLQGDAVMALAGFGGLRIAIGGLRAPFTVDVGARYVRNGVAEYVDDISRISRDDSTGEWVVPVTRSRADFLAYQLGVSYLFGGRR